MSLLKTGVGTADPTQSIPWFCARSAVPAPMSWFLMQGYFPCSLGGRGWAQLEVLLAAGLWAHRLSLQLCLPWGAISMCGWMGSVTLLPRGCPRTAPAMLGCWGLTPGAFLAEGSGSLGVFAPSWCRDVSPVSAPRAELKQAQSLQVSPAEPPPALAHAGCRAGSRDAGGSWAVQKGKLCVVTARHLDHCVLSSGSISTIRL